MERSGSNDLAGHFDSLCHDADAARAIILRLGVRAETTNPGVCVSPHSRGNADDRWHVIFVLAASFSPAPVARPGTGIEGRDTRGLPGEGFKDRGAPGDGAGFRADAPPQNLRAKIRIVPGFAGSPSLRLHAIKPTQNACDNSEVTVGQFPARVSC